MNTKTQVLPFNYKLILNQWLITQCGFDPLATHKADSGCNAKLRPLQGIASILRDCAEGMDADNLHYFYKELNIKWSKNAPVTRGDLLRYEQNIVSHTLSINEQRSRPIMWKYYQWLSLLFVEIYLDQYFAQRENLLESLNNYVKHFNAYWQAKNFETTVEPYSLNELNKLCLQNATGSGKTLLMHVNFLQFRQYANASRFKDDITRTVLITPNEGLSNQHVREMNISNIYSTRLSTDSNDYALSRQNGFIQIDFTEITKLSDEDGPTQIAVRNLGDQNLLLVDEAHRGMGSKEETGWFRRRERLVEKGFVFEYSATFKEAITAANRSEIEAAYAKNILFDYSYRYFYEDGYGKDYRIFNLPKSYKELRFRYLTACLLAFYQQIKLYEDRKTDFKPYNVEKPLWVFVGKSVIKATGSRDDQETVSDVALILQFIAQILKNESASAAVIEKILTTHAQDTGLMDETGNDIFADSFHYIRELRLHAEWTFHDVLRDIFRKVFLNASGGQLTLAKIKGNDNEIMLRVGQEEIPFGLINVGDAAGLIKHIEQRKNFSPNDFDNVNILEAEFSETLFGQVHESSSPVTVLLGSKKFVEGWDCWRVSTLGLMHVGRSEGSQIIQLFGRGVRLKGYDWTLKRSGFSTPADQPEYIQYLETLNVFGVQADFMDRFKKFLEHEGLPGNDKKVVYTIPLTITYDFTMELKVLRPRRKDKNGNEYEFARDARVPSFADKIPDVLHEKLISIDWYPRIQSLDSRTNRTDAHKHKAVFSNHHLAFLNYDDLFHRVEKFKRERAWYNLNIPKPAIRKLLHGTTWYEMFVPAQNIECTDVSNIFLWQEMAGELVQKYCDELYNYHKGAFIEPRLELRPLTRDDGNIPNEKEYQFVVDGSEQALINNIRVLKDNITHAQRDIPKVGDLKACIFNTHLYQPVLNVVKNSKIQIIPAVLNESEFKFVEDLYRYLNTEKYHQNRGGSELYLLRNNSRGGGIGFFEAGNFYPDFILWKVKEDFQYIAFIDPHGLIHAGPGDKKIEFHKRIKVIQDRLSAELVCLNSFIVTSSRFLELNWDMSIEDFAQKNVYFMFDRNSSDNDNYISSIISRMEE
ncbi:MAG: DEAD/DEAH box helicase family protein [Salinispira sp.]